MPVQKPPSTPFSEYLHARYLEWKAASPANKTIFHFACWLGVPYPTLQGWLNQGCIPTKPKLIQSLLNRFGPSAIQTFAPSAPVSAITLLNIYPNTFTECTFAVAIEAARLINKAGISPSSPEAQQIISTLLSKH